MFKLTQLYKAINGECEKKMIFLSVIFTDAFI